MKSDEVKLYDVGTVEEFRRRGFTAESRPLIHVEPQEVPPSLRHLIPLGER
jgi:uroporphyrinogen-III synthase